MILSNSISNELSDQLSSLLFEMDFSVTPKQMKRFLLDSYKQCFYRLRRAAISEGLIRTHINSHSIDSYLALLQLHSKNTKNTFKNWHLLQEELNESIANQAMALAYQHQWHKKLSRMRNRIQVYGPGYWNNLSSNTYLVF